MKQFQKLLIMRDNNKLKILLTISFKLYQIFQEICQTNNIILIQISSRFIQSN